MSKILTQLSTNHALKCFSSIVVFPQKISSKFKQINISPRFKLTAVIVVVSPVSLFITTLAVLHLLPGSVAYSYDKSFNCITAPTLFPEFIKSGTVSSLKSF